MLKVLSTILTKADKQSKSCKSQPRKLVVVENGDIFVDK